MANREACELWIEQEIESGLEEGKTPYSIGKELSLMIERLFETKIQPRTIEQRARRHNDHDATNVAEKSKDPINSDYQESEPEKQILRFESGRGGKRDGAGRPNNPITDRKQEDCEAENKDIITFDAGNEKDLREMGKLLAGKINSGEAKPLVGSPVSTAVKEALKKGVKPEPKPINNFERLSKHAFALNEGLTFWADETMKPESEQESLEARTVIDCAVSIIVQYSRIGVNVLSIYEMFIDPKRRDYKNGKKEITTGNHHQDDRLFNRNES